MLLWGVCLGQSHHSDPLLTLWKTQIDAGSAFFPHPSLPASSPASNSQTLELHDVPEGIWMDVTQML